MANDTLQPIIVKRVKKVVHGGHHGGAWKVAYADFVTAMMAFFMLLWLMGSTTQQQKRAIADFFEYPSAIEASGGVSTSLINIGDEVPDVATGTGDNAPSKAQTEAAATAEAAEAQDAEDEKTALAAVKSQLEEAIEGSETLSQFKDQILIDITSDGLRVQIVDKDKRPMFDRGSAKLQGYARVILDQVIAVMKAVPNKISISGHTDAHAYPSETGYSNWELSADRANAARRELISAGLSEGRLAEVTGLGSSVLYDTHDPFNPVNRRISITLLNRAAHESVMEKEGPQLKPPVVTSVRSGDLVMNNPAVKPPTSSTAKAATGPVAAHTAPVRAGDGVGGDETDRAAW